MYQYTLLPSHKFQKWLAFNMMSKISVFACCISRMSHGRCDLFDYVKPAQLDVKSVCRQLSCRYRFCNLAIFLCSHSPVLNPSLWIRGQLCAVIPPVFMRLRSHILCAAPACSRTNNQVKLIFGYMKIKIVYIYIYILAWLFTTSNKKQPLEFTQRCVGVWGIARSNPLLLTPKGRRCASCLIWRGREMGVRVMSR